LPAATPVTVKVPVLPLAILTLAGKLTIPAGTAARLIVTPPAGVGALSVIVPVTVFVRPTVWLLRASVIAGSVTFTVVKPGCRPDPVDEAIIDVLPGPTGVIVAVVVFDPCGIVTVVGALTTVESMTASLMLRPPGPAFIPVVIVRVPVALRSKSSGLGVNTIPEAVAVTVTVDGLLLENASLTINWTT